jgi:FkbM family methyltransferase
MSPIAAILPHRVRSKLVRSGFLKGGPQSNVADRVLPLIARYKIKGDRGFYIECGAFDGVSSSNTIALERLGWRGLLVEPSPAAMSACKKNRNADANIFAGCALVADASVTEVSGDFDGSAMSSINAARSGTGRQQAVPARTLQSLLDENGVGNVDFFSLDVEGFELDVLRGLDFTKNAPMSILIEVYSKDRKAIEQYLAERGYAPPANISRFNATEFPLWDGTHNDYLFVHESAAQQLV